MFFKAEMPQTPPTIAPNIFIYQSGIADSAIVKYCSTAAGSYSAQKKGAANMEKDPRLNQRSLSVRLAISHSELFD